MPCAACTRWAEGAHQLLLPPGGRADCNLHISLSAERQGAALRRGAAGAPQRGAVRLDARLAKRGGWWDAG